MSEEKNIPPSDPKDSGSDRDKVEDVNKTETQKFPEDKQAPATKVEQTKSAKEIMEVHHHGHVHETKKWKEYLFQFFMLFLAVFCGFLAEYQLEHVIEHKREKQYMRTLLEDLKKDTTSLEECIRFWTHLGNKIDHTRPLLKSLDKQNNPEEIYEMAAMLVDFNDFIYSDRTIEQLRNSGNFRLIRKQHVSDTIMSYDSFIRIQLREQEGTLLKILLNLLSLQNESFDSDLVESKFNTLKNRNPSADSSSKKYNIRNNEEKLFKYYNDLFVYRVGIRYMLSSETGLKKWATNLIDLVKKEYKLE